MLVELDIPPRLEILADYGPDSHVGAAFLSMNPSVFLHDDPVHFEVQTGELGLHLLHVANTVGN